MAQSSPILDVDLPAFESGDAATRAAVVDGTMRSLATGFVYVRHDLSEDLLDDAYGRLAAFFSLPQDRKDRCRVPGSNGQTGYTGLLVETAAISDVPDWKEMLNWSAPVPDGHPLRKRFPHRYGDPTLPDDPTPTGKPSAALQTVTGVVERSPEDRCVTLAATGRTWVLTGTVAGLEAGDRVTVRGRPDPDATTTCQRGPVLVVAEVERG